MPTTILILAIAALPQAPPVIPGLDPAAKQQLTAATCCEQPCRCCEACRCGEAQTELSRADEAQSTKTPLNTLVVYNADWCEPCRRWKRECLPALREAGWHVEFRPPAGPVLSFEYRGEFWRGYGYREGFMDRLRKAIR